MWFFFNNSVDRTEFIALTEEAEAEIYSLEFVSWRRWTLIEVDRSRTVKRWKSPAVRVYRQRQPIPCRSAFFTWLHSWVFWRQVVGEFAWYNKGSLQYMNRRYFSPTKAVSGREAQGSYTDPGKRQGNRGEKDRREGGGGRRVSNGEEKRCERICSYFVFMKFWYMKIPTWKWDK